MVAGADPAGVPGAVRLITPVAGFITTPTQILEQIRRAAGGAVLLSGPTASGKSTLALELAESWDGEILSADSMQVYEGLDVGTAKPTLEERRRVRHHLIDLVPPSAAFTAADWLHRAAEAYRDIRARGKLPIICGGTGLYFRALLHGLDLPGPGDLKRRSELEARDLDDLLNELYRLAPASWERIDRRNRRRVVRALEVALGRHSSAGGISPVIGPGDRTVFVLRRTPDDLRRRINLRVEQMFRDGLVEETRQLISRGLADNRSAMQAIGYRQVVAFLRGDSDLQGTIDEVKRRTWHLARRQMTWFRHQLPVEWIDLPGVEA